tara:strand:- start:130586 stop:131452 length:867 start_codon:yes stop_codon:yes gene_type:complete
MTTEEAMTDATENEMEIESEIENDLSESSDVQESDSEISELSEEGEIPSENGTVAANETNVVGFPANATEHAELMRMTEALLFAAAEPLDIDSITSRLPEGADVGAVIEDLQKLYEERGVNLVRVANKWMFRTAENLSFLMEREAVEQRKLSRPAMETLAIIAYHQPVTRAEIEEIRGVSVSKGTLDVLIETGWVRLRGRKRTPGRPVTYGTTEDFLIHFGLEAVGDLPGLDDLKSSGLLDGRLPPGFEIPIPTEGGVEGDGEFEDEPAEEYGEAHDEHLAVDDGDTE